MKSDQRGKRQYSLISYQSQLSIFTRISEGLWGYIGKEARETGLFFSHLVVEMQRAWQMEGMDSPWKLEVGDSRAPVGAKTIFFHFPCRMPERR